MAKRVLTRRELNRALLARQMLLERAPAPLPRALERMGGLQAQYAPSMYVGLWSRTESMAAQPHPTGRDSLTRALEGRSVIQGTLLRATIHLVSRADYWPCAAAIRRPRRDWAMRVMGAGLTNAAMERAARRLRAALAQGPLRRTEIEELLGKQEAKLVGMWVDLVRVPPAGTWERRRADLYGLAADWVGLDQASEDQGIELLMRRYLAAFGPATRNEAADWAGLPVRAVQPVLERVAGRRFRGEDGAELMDLPRAPLPDPETPAPVRMLPTYDAVLLAHARRTGILPEEHRPRIFNTKMPQSIGTFLVDGAVAGTWKPDGKRIVIDPFERLDRATRLALDEEVERLAAFHAS